MTISTLIFYPETYVGFNKTLLLERNLSTVGLIGSNYRSSSVFSTGHNFRQYIPRVDSIHKYECGLIRVQIQAVGVWTRMANKMALLECSNIVLVEGDVIGYPLNRYASLCELLHQITGDRYLVDVAHDSMPQGVSEAGKYYDVWSYPDPVTLSPVSTPIY